MVFFLIRSVYVKVLGVAFEFVMLKRNFFFALEKGLLVTHTLIEKLISHYSKMK